MRAVIARAAIVAERRARAVEFTTPAAVVAIFASEFGTRLHHFARATWRWTLLPAIPCWSGTAIGAASIELRAGVLRRHRRTHFVFSAAEVATLAALRHGAVIVHHPALMPAHALLALSHARVAGASGSRSAALIHERRARSTFLLAKTGGSLKATTIGLRLVETFRLHRRWRTIATEITVGPSLLLFLLRAILTSGAIFALLIGSAHLPAITLEATFARTALAILRTCLLIAPAFGAIGIRASGTVFPLRWILWRWLRSIFLSGERP